MMRLAGGCVVVLLATAAWGADWPQWLGPQRDGVWRETNLLAKFPAEGLKPAWRVPIGAGYAGPAVADGRVYLADRKLAPGTKNAANPFARGEVPGDEGIVCLDANTGEKVWEHRYPCPYRISYASGPRATPVVSGGRVYAVGAMGDLVCLNAADGKPVWTRNFVKEHKVKVPIWGFSASPLLDGNRLICMVGGETEDGNQFPTVVALHKDTGKDVWQALPAREPGYCPPVIFNIGGKPQLIIWHASAAAGLDPATGKVFWELPWEVKAGMSIPTPRLLSGERLFLSCFYNGSALLQLSADPPGMKVLWQGKQFKPKGKSELPDNTDGLHSVMATPVVVGEHIYGICSYGQLRCIKAADGSRVWETMQAVRGPLTDAKTAALSKPGDRERWAHAFIVAEGERFWLFNEQGELLIAKLSPQGYEEISRTSLIKATNNMALGRPTVWTHPAFANQKLFVRNDEEVLAVSLAKTP